MPHYDPEKLLLSIHIPKCGGTSFSHCLTHFFGNRLHLHYPDEPHPGPPQACTLKRQACVHGHFYHHQWAIGALDYYPQASQFITLLRDPLEMTLSGYYYRRRLGDLASVSVTQYLDEILETPVLFNFLGLPFDLWKTSMADIEEWLAQRFIWMGLTERFQDSVDLLALKIGKTTVDIPVDNASPREGNLADYPSFQKKFRQRYRREYALYDYARRRLDRELAQHD